MTNYILVEQSLYDDDTLEEAVNKKMAAGYTILGPPILINSSSSETIGAFKGLTNTSTRFTYAQPMIKEDK